MKRKNNKVDVLLGLQWGDEGKGKIIDVLTPKYDIIARFQGGPNAGHTLEFNGQKRVLHLIPSGIFHPGKMNLLGNGMVIDPIAFKQEIEELMKDISWEELKKRIVISSGAILIMPTHRLLDQAYEAAKGNGKIGTTGKGIGPAYTDHISRNALHVGDILEKGFDGKHGGKMFKHSYILKSLKYDIDPESLIEKSLEFLSAIDFMRKLRIVNGSMWLNEQLDAGNNVLAEGAQGTLLDVNFGSYPFVTSSNTTVGGVCTGLGIAPNRIRKVYGLFKAYCTRVGAGPFPTELGGKQSDEWCANKKVEDEENIYPDANINDSDPFIQGIALRRKGCEFGATTGRLRRTGWLDMHLLKYACMINGVTDLIISKADVLSDIQVKVSTGYAPNGDPEYITFSAWKNLQKHTSYENLQTEFMRYIKYIEAETNTPITMISTGPDREQIIMR